MAKDSRLVNSRWFKVLVSILLLLVVLAFATPYIVKQLLTQSIAPSYGLRLSMATPSISWHRAAVSMAAVELRDDQNEILARIGNASVDINLAALFNREVQLESVVISEFDVNVDVDGSDSNLNRQLTLINEKLTSRMVSTDTIESPDEGASERWRFSLLAFQLQRGSLGYSDQQHPNSPADELLVIERLEVNGLVIDPVGQRVDIGRISSSSLVANGWVSDNGDLNISQLLAGVVPPTPAQNSTSQNEGASGDLAAEPVANAVQQVYVEEADATRSEMDPQDWIVALNQVAIENYQLNFWDMSLERPASYQVGPIDISLANFETKPFQEAEVNFEASLGGESLIAINGTLQLIPLVADTDISVIDLELSQFQPYVDAVSWAEVESGSINLMGHLSARLIGDEEPMVSYRGDISVDDLRIVDRRDGSFVVGHETLNISGLDFSLADMMVSADEAKLLNSKLTMSINSNGDFSLLSLARVSEEELIEEGKKVEEVGSQFDLQVKVARIENGEFHFSDDSLSSPFDMTIGLDHIQINGLSTLQRPESAVARLNFGRAGVLEFDGATENEKTVANYRIADLPMANVSGYIAALSGYEVQRGTFNLDGNYTISDAELRVDNELKVRGFELGRAIRSEDTLPLPLASAMLTDSNGDIELDLPIRGNLDDPSFSVTGVAADVMTQAIINAATSPFTLLGGLVGGGDFNVVVFSPRSYELKASEKLKLDQLALALLSKPTLRLRITPIAHNQLDSDQQRPLSEAEKSRLSVLADKRAEAIVSYLTSETELAQERLQIINPVRTSAPTAEVELILSLQLVEK